MDPRWMLAGLLAAAPLAAGGLRSAKAPAPAAGPLGQGVLKKVLPNGLTLLVKPVRSAPVVAVNAWVKVGSVHEREAERGITHFIEHMLFKGTESMRVGELDRLIKAAGGYNNAHTRYESTDFIDVLPADKLEVALRSMADALQHSTFDAAELKREREVVLEELHRAQDNPGFEAWNRLTQLAFRRHPYRYPIIGFKERLQAMDRELLVAYWRRWYQPQNAAVVVVGDVDGPAALASAEAAFAAWPATRERPAALPREPKQGGLRYEESEGEMQGSVAILGWPGCAELDPDAPALDMALDILGSGISSRLNQSVRERQKLVHSVAAGQFNGADPGLAYLWAELEPEQVKPALKALWEEVRRLGEEGPSQEELQRQRLRLEHDQAAEAMSMEGMAGRLGYYESLGGDYRLADRQLERQRSVSAADVQAAVRKYLRLEGLNAVVRRGAKSRTTGLDAAALRNLLEAGSPAAPAPAAAGGSPEPGGLTRYRLAAGGSLLVKPARHAPLVAVQMSFPGGQSLEPAAQAGALNLLARCLPKGLPGQDAAALARAMDDLGLELQASAEGDRFSLSLQALASRLPESLEFAARLLREAELPEAELAKEKARVLKDIKDKSDSPDDYCMELFNAAFFGPRHPYGRPLEGQASTLRALNRAQLLALKARALRPEGMQAVVVGDVDAARARQLFEDSFGPGAWAPAGKAPAPARLPALQPGPRRKAVRLKDKKQAHLVLGWACPPPSHPDYPALRLVNSVLGEGMDSRLFHEVREKRGLCYTVYSGFDRRLAPGAWRVYVGTRPENLKQAEALCRQVVGELAAGGLSAAELSAAKAYAKGIFQVARQDFSTDARVLANYEFWGLGAAAAEDVARRLDAVSLEDCRRVARRWLKPGLAVVASVQP